MMTLLLRNVSTMIKTEETSPHFTEYIQFNFNTLRPRQNGRHFADDTFKRIFLNQNIRISIEISLKFVPNGPINNIPALVQIMAWRRPGDKPLSEPMMVRSLTHICVTRPQWVNCMDSFFLLHIRHQPLSVLNGMANVRLATQRKSVY